jgi:conjugative transposon TraM protein
MDLFREQMKLVDSIQRQSQRNGPQGSGSGNAGIGDRQPDVGKRFDPSTDTTFKPMAVSLQPQWASDVHRKGFYTLRTQSPAPLVSAMIDQELKVHAGNRIRIRLLQDIYVGGTRVPKGTYLYAQVTGFQTSRINLSITSVFLHGRTLPVELDIYDNDGYLGLYVPGSSFREFTKDIGTQATRGLSQLQTADQSDIAASLLSQLFETATSATTKMIKKEKAVLTYNYSIYLKEKQ